MMKVLVLLMLVCSVYTNEIKTLSDQQPCLQDVHAALREITASLAETKVEVRYLQAENKDQQTEVETLKKQLQEQAAKLEDQQTEVDELKKQLQEQAAKLDKQEDQLQGKQVAFSASLVATGSQTFGPLHQQTPLVYEHVVTNIGNAYSPVTGAFTAPLKGAYHFEMYIYGHGSSYNTGAYLVKNTENIFLAYEYQGPGAQSASNGATLLLEAGDVVFVLLPAGFAVYDNTNHYNTFSGHMLFTM